MSYLVGARSVALFVGSLPSIASPALSPLKRQNGRLSAHPSHPTPFSHRSAYLQKGGIRRAVLESRYSSPYRVAASKMTMSQQLPFLLRCCSEGAVLERWSNQLTAAVRQTYWKYRTHPISEFGMVLICPFPLKFPWLHLCSTNPKKKASVYLYTNTWIVWLFQSMDWLIKFSVESYLLCRPNNPRLPWPMHDHPPCSCIPLMSQEFGQTSVLVSRILGGQFFPLTSPTLCYGLDFVQREPFRRRWMARMTTLAENPPGWRNPSFRTQEVNANKTFKALSERA